MKKKGQKPTKERFYFVEFGVWASDIKEAKKLSKLNSSK